MRLRVGLTALSAVAALTLAAQGCSDDSSGTTNSKPAPEATADRLPELPQGWEKFESGGGFALGLPPGWQHDRLSGDLGAVFTSPDGLVTVSVTADRTSGALALPLDQYARRTAAALGSADAGKGRFTDLHIGKPKDFDASYPASAVTATGTPANSKTPERVLVVAVRRPRLASFAVVVRANEKTPSPYADRKTIERMIASISDRPVT